TGSGGVPENARAVLMNVTGVPVSALGYLTVYPDTDGDGHTAAPHASTLNYATTSPVANMVIVELPADGQINYLTSNQARVVFDVIGYIPAS
ncbi:MAG: hypothetical protein ABI232_02260, partial [Jatrophihabitantaceae bacterium]